MTAGRVRRFFRWLYRNRSVSFTPEGKRFMVLALAIGLAAVNTGNNLLYLLLAMMLSLIVLSGVLSEQCIKNVSITRRMPEHLFAQTPTSAYFQITNRKQRLPSFSLHLKDLIEDQPVDRGVYVLYLAPGASVLQSYPLLIPRRGHYRIDGVLILTRFPFSLFIKGLSIPLDSEVLVYPPIKPLPSVLHSDLAALGHEQDVHRRGHGVDLYNLRLYQPRDDSRAIHWRTTARTNVLTVRETQAEEHRRVTVVLPTLLPPGISIEGLGDSDPDETAELAELTGLGEYHEMFERAVELTASLVMYFREASFVVHAIIGERAITPDTEPDPLHAILRALSWCQPQAPRDPEASLRIFGERIAQSAAEHATLLVLPWADPRLESLCAGVHRVIRVSDFREALA